MNRAGRVGIDSLSSPPILPHTATPRTMNSLALVPLLLVVPSPQEQKSDLELPAVFSNGMVLQRDSEVPLWGWTAPGSEVRVRGSWDGASTVNARADANGRFEALLRTPGAGGPFEVTLESGASSRTLDDVLVGEVWLCSGQSNMEWPLAAIIEHARADADLPDATLAIERPDVRYFDVERAIAKSPVTGCEGEWRAAVGDDALDCTAVGYFFACELQEALGVPIGLLDSNWGGTRSEAWTSPRTIAKFPRHAVELQSVLADVDAKPTEAQLAFWSEASSAPADDAEWIRQDLPALIEDGPLGEHDGIFRMARTIVLPDGWIGADLTLEIPPVDDLDLTLWNGEPIGTTLARGGWNTPRSYRIPGALVNATRNRIEIVGLDTGGAGGMGDADAPFRVSKSAETLELAGEWRLLAGPEIADVPRVPYADAFDQHTPTALFNGMIAPLVPYGVRGVTWYQGESNAQDPGNYREMFPAMIVDWREHWDAPELPFYFVQLAPHDYGGDGEPDRNVAETRDAQAAALELPATGMALTADIGWRENIHPLDKWNVGKRLALFALHDIHGETDLEPWGPMLSGTEPYGGALTVRFDHTAGGLEARGELAHFEIASDDGAFVPARAEITESGDAVVLKANGISRPTRARYLWSDSAEATLFGGTGLPAAPFHTVPSRAR